MPPSAQKNIEPVRTIFRIHGSLCEQHLSELSKQRFCSHDLIIFRRPIRFDFKILDWKDEHLYPYIVMLPLLMEVWAVYSFNQVTKTYFGVFLCQRIYILFF